MGRPPTIDWKIIDPDILDPKLRNCEIVKRHNISDTSVSLRRKKFGCREKNVTMPPRTTSHMPVKKMLFEKALKSKAASIGKPVRWVREVWLNGEAGKRFIRDGGYEEAATSQ